MTLQYIRPVMIGDSSSAMTASIVSSSNRRPAGTWSCWMSARPCAWRAAADRSASLKQSPIAAALAAVACAASILSFAELLFDGGQDHVAALHAVTAFNESLPSRDPRIRLAHLPAKQEAETEPERTARGARRVTRVQMSTMETFEEPLKLEIATRQVRRRGQPFQIVDV